MKAKKMKCLVVFVCILSFVLVASAADVSSTTAPGKESPASPPVSPPTPVPTTTGTPEPSPAPSPTPAPIIESQKLDFNITDPTTKQVCALFSFTGTVRLHAKDEKPENDTIVYLLNSTSVVAAGSSCSANVTVLQLSLNGTVDTLALNLEHTGSTYKLNQITLTIGGIVYQANGTKVSTDDTKSYLCQAEQNYKLNSTKTDVSASLSITNLKIDAFRKDEKSNDFRQAMQCEEDYPTNDFVPLAVGCALISLVLIVLIAYIVGRRRSKRLSYTSV